MGPTSTSQPPRRGVGRDGDLGSRSLPLELPDAAHREGDIPDAAHGVAVVSRVDSPGEDLMQMHLRSPGWQGTAREERRAPRPTARALPAPPPSGPTPRRLRLNASPPSCLPPSSSLPWELLDRCRRPDRRSAAEMPGCSHSLLHRRTNAGGAQGCV